MLNNVHIKKKKEKKPNSVSTADALLPQLSSDNIFMPATLNSLLQEGQQSVPILIFCFSAKNVH
jgi:hypothetical protein